MKITPAFSLSNLERKIYYKFSLFANSAEIRYDRREYRTIQGEYMRISKKRFWAVLLLSLAALVAGCSQENHQAERKLSSFEPKEVKELRKKEVAQSDGERSEYFFQQLPEEEQRIYREILEGVQQYQEQIYVSSADNEAIDKTYHAILRDHPEVFWIHNRETTYKTVYSTYTVFEPGYQIGQDEIPAVESEMEAAYQTVAGGLLENAGDYEKAKAVYEYVISVSYTHLVSLHDLWARRHGTKYNGAPYIVQKAGAAVYTKEGKAQIKNQISYYMENASMILEGLKQAGYQVYGGVNAPYIWLKTPGRMSSWEFFDELLKNANVVGTPGSGFGPHGEGYFRLTAFGTHENTKKALERIARM